MDDWDALYGTAAADVPMDWGDAWVLPDEMVELYSQELAAQDPSLMFDPAYVSPEQQWVDDYYNYDRMEEGLGEGSTQSWGTSYGISPEDAAAYEQAFNQVEASLGQASSQIELEGVAVRQNADGSYTVVNRTTGQPLDPNRDRGVWDTLKGIMAPINSFLQSPVGKVLGAAGVGGATLGLARALAGNTPTFKAPTPQAPNPIYTASQQALLRALNESGGANLTEAVKGGLAGQANLGGLLQRLSAQQLEANIQQAPGQATVREEAMGRIPGLMDSGGGVLNAEQMAALAAGQYGDMLTGGPQGPLQDSIQAGLSAEINRVLSGQYSNPQLEDQITRAREQMENEIAQQLGPRNENSTPAIQRRAEFEKQALFLREQQKQAVVGAYAPIEQQRRAYNIQTPQDMQRQWLAMLQPQAQAGTQLAENARLQNLQNAATLSQFGLPGFGPLSNTLQQTVPMPPLLGLGATDQLAAANRSAEMQAALQNYQAQVQDRNALSSGVGSLGGMIAGGLLGVKPAPSTGLTV